MKKVGLILTILLMTATLALAEWLTGFQDTYSESGIDDAVVFAMKEGIDPELIVEQGLQLKKLNPANLIKALYCAGAQGEDIKRAARKWELSDVVIAAGYKKSVSECEGKLAESQPFTPVAAGTTFTGIDPGFKGRKIVSRATP